MSDFLANDGSQEAMTRAVSDATAIRAEQARIQAFPEWQAFQRELERGRPMLAQIQAAAQRQLRPLVDIRAVVSK